MQRLSPCGARAGSTAHQAIRSTLVGYVAPLALRLRVFRVDSGRP